MSDLLTQLANEAIQLELNVGKLYLLFRDICPDDSDFWWTLTIEESNHAALIRAGIDFFMEADLFPVEILPPVITDLQKTNSKLTAWHKHYAQTLPSRQEAFNLALEIERSAGEIHFQRMMAKTADSKVTDLFQKLNGEDKNHVERIGAYMKDKGIQALS